MLNLNVRAVRRDRINTQLDALSSEVSSLKQQIGQLDTQLVAARGTITQLTTQLATQDKEVAEARDAQNK